MTQLIVQANGFLVTGSTPLRGAVVDNHHDHQLGIAGLLAAGRTVIQDSEDIADSFPALVSTLSELGSSTKEIA